MFILMDIFKGIFGPQSIIFYSFENARSWLNVAFFGVFRSLYECQGLE